ncbi:heavy metal translocating P-type ATPase [Metabacillus herbersteinensis]|uniref:Cd(2+)-exporting ATPase n=1 Tax=Metabacillus herbersteinensis TaxID=283816 RepID=A0ABV6GEP7_9BACI
MQEAEKTVYRIQGFTCAGCATTFEKNVKSLNGVADAKVNFGAAKLTVYGEATIQQLEKAGSFEGLKVTSEHEKIEYKKEPFYKRHGAILISALFLLAGWFVAYQSGEESTSSNLLFAASIVVGGYRLFQTGIINLIRFQFDMKTLMTVAIIGAAIIGEWGEGATVVILFAISEALESYSMDKARQSIRSLMDVAPTVALVKRNNQEFLLDVDEIVVGDIIIVKPGQKIAMDGVVVNGASTINQAAITGESVPILKEQNDEVFAGTLNEEGLLEIKVTKRAEDATIAKIIHLVEEAQAERAPSQAFVDKFAKYYTPAIMFVALCVAILPPLFLGAAWSTWIYQGLAVLVVGCPCALVISTPVAIVTAIGNAARNGVLIKGGIHLEETGQLRAIAFDKTGTLTKGLPIVTDFQTLSNHSESELLTIIAAFENRSAHPLASAIVKRADLEKLNYQSINVEDFSSITGKGIKGLVNGELYLIGSPSFIKEALGELLLEKVYHDITELQEQGKTVIVTANTKEIVAIMAVADEVRESSRDVVKRLTELGIEKTIMLTGDNQATALAIGNQVGVSNIESELLPQDKLTYIKDLRSRFGKVGMVGDGVNDAPAMAASTVGIAMGGAGTDTALETADIALMGDDLKKLPFTIKLSRQALKIIKQNITFSLGIKLVALLLVVPGWLTLWIAIFADMGATLLVTLNALRLLKLKD